jgi:hypothetical protein
MFSLSPGEWAQILPRVPVGRKALSSSLRENYDFCQFIWKIARSMRVVESTDFS